MSFKIVLTTEQVTMASKVGLQRHRVHVQARRHDAKVLSDGEAVHVQGALAEYAVALMLGRKWDGKLFDNEDWLQWRDHGHDVDGLEVRSTKRPDGCLLLHPKDRDDAPFVLVIPESSLFTIRGWCFGREGKLPKYWRDVGYGRPCYYVPQAVLRPTSSLREETTQ